MTDYKEYVKQMRENAVKNEQGNIVCSLELWEEIASVIERAIIPPCKVGDILFCIFSDKSIDKVYTHIEACKVREIMFFESGSFVIGVREINKHYNHNVVFGENAFKTFEEAEEKLKELGK